MGSCLSSTYQWVHVYHSSADAVQIELDMLHGDIALMRQKHPNYFTKYLNITQKLGFADVIAPGKE